jgi:hypothetical protein
MQKIKGVQNDPNASAKGLHASNKNINGDGA